MPRLGGCCTATGNRSRSTTTAATATTTTTTTTTPCCFLAWLPIPRRQNHPSLLQEVEEKEDQPEDNNNKSNGTAIEAHYYFRVPNFLAESGGAAATTRRSKQQQPPSSRATKVSSSSHQYLLYPSTTTATTTAIATMERQQGVLWKRRDVFKNRWRPRWFVLHPSQGVLTYYLLNAPDTYGNSSSSSSAIMRDATPLPHSQQQRSIISSSSNNNSRIATGGTGTMSHTTTTTTTASEPSRARTTSWDSVASQQSVDYDVVPRGTIDLLGCTVTVNAALSKPDFFAFTIHSPSAVDVDVHLAARSAQTRSLWIRRLVIVCNGGRMPTPVVPRCIANTATTTSTTDNRAAAVAAATTPLLTLNESAIMNGGDTATTEATQTSSSPSSSSSSSAASARTCAVSWKSATPESPSLYANLDTELAESIRSKLKTYLAMCNQDFEQPQRQNGWKKLFDRTVSQNPHKAYRRRHSDDTTLVCSTAVLNHTPQQVFNLLIDYTHRQDYESNVRCVERLKAINAHTFFDYYAYNAVWPTAAREFAIVTHWQVVTRQPNQLLQQQQQQQSHHHQDRAIAMISFSCAAADALKAPAADHVRGKLHVSMYLLRPVYTTTTMSPKCHLTRFLSFDLAGGVSSKLSNVILTQQANLPTVIAEHLKRHEPIPENRLLGLQFSNESLEESIIRYLGRRQSATAASPSVRRQLTFAENESIVEGEVDDKASLLEEEGSSQAPSVETQAFLLLGPVAFYKALLYSSWVPSEIALIVFFIIAYSALRQVVLLHMGDNVMSSRNDDAALVGPVTCRFTVDLKGVLRYIQNKKEEREELQQDHHEEVTFVHLVATAVAKAWAKEKELRIQRISYPLLMIDEIIDVSSEPVHVSVSENAGGVVTVEGVDRRSVQSVADELSRADARTVRSHKLGHCLILATPDCEDGVCMETDPLA